MSKEERFQTVFNELKAILQPYEEYLQLQADEPENYSLNAAFSPRYKQEVFFGAAQVRKNYVSYYLMSVYKYPSLLEGISPDLKKRM